MPLSSFLELFDLAWTPETQSGRRTSYAACVTTGAPVAHWMERTGPLAGGYRAGAYWRHMRAFRISEPGLAAWLAENLCTGCQSIRFRVSLALIA